MAQMFFSIFNASLNAQSICSFRLAFVSLVLKTVLLAHPLRIVWDALGLTISIMEIASRLAPRLSAMFVVEYAHSVLHPIAISVQAQIYA